MSEPGFDSRERLEKNLASISFRQRQAVMVARALKQTFEKPEPITINPTLNDIPQKVSQLIVGNLDAGNMEAYKSHPYRSNDVDGETLQGRIVRLDIKEKANTPSINADIYLLVIMGHDQSMLEPANILSGLVETEHEKIAPGSHQRILFNYIVSGQEPNVSVEITRNDYPEDYFNDLPASVLPNMENYFDSIPVLGAADR
jgi:hypothetical protein